MTAIARPIRIDNAFADPATVQSLFRCNGPYDCLGVSAPDGVDPRGDDGAALPWFRGNWAVSGEPLVEGAEAILFNQAFVDAAHEAFGAAVVVPTTVVVNLNAPMVSGAPHVDIPAFRGATREDTPLRLLAVMGESGLFERWRVVEAGAVSWFYRGAGGDFDYWPHGLDGAVATESPPFGNVAILADNNQMYHRVRAVGRQGTRRPRVSKSAQIMPDGEAGWVMRDGERTIAYVGEEIRLSVLWKAEIFRDAAERDTRRDGDVLTQEKVIDVFDRDMAARGRTPPVPPDTLADGAWIETLQRVYYDTPAAGRI